MRKKRKDNNVVKFPTIVRDKPKKDYLRAKQVGACFMIVFTLFAVPMLNTISTTPDAPTRAIANVDETGEGKKQLRRLSRKSAKTLYSVGRKANPLEQFQYGELYGAYTIKRELNKISQVHLIQDSNMIEVKDRKKFIKKHKKIWYVDFDLVETVSDNLEDDELVEEFILYKKSQEVGRATARSKQDHLVMLSLIRH